MTSLPSAVYTHARRSPSRIAIEAWDEHQGVTLRVTYRDLAQAVAAAALALSESGLASGARFGMCAHNSVAYAAVALGGMSLGAVSVNLNWRQPEPLNVRLLRDLEVRLLIHDEPFEQLAAAAVRLIGYQSLLTLQLEAVCSMDRLRFAPPSEERYRAVVAAEAALPRERTAAVFFTGGTTGTPKAVPHTHVALVWAAERMAAQFPSGCFADAAAGTICFAPYFHVMGFVANLAFNLIVGVRAAVLSSAEAKLHPRLVLAACRALRPTVPAPRVHKRRPSA